MPLTLTVPVPSGLFTPGSQIIVGTNLVGPIPIDYEWHFSLVDQATERVQLQMRIVTNGSRTMSCFWLDPNFEMITANQFETNGFTNPRLLVELTDRLSNVVESLSVPVTYNPTVGLPIILQAKQTGGLTAQEQQQLSETHTYTQTMDTNWQQFEAVTLPSLQDVLSGITAAVTSTITNAGQGLATTIGQMLSRYTKDTFGVFNWTGGPTCDPIDANIGGTSYFGMELRITVRPDYFVPMTPDQEWVIQDMAVVRCYIGDELVMRTGIHMLTWSMAPLPGMLDIGVANLGVPLAPPGYHVMVDWAMGVCGELLLQYIP